MIAQGLDDQLRNKEILYPRTGLNDECVAADLRHDAVEPFQL